MAAAESFEADYEALTNGRGFAELKDWSTIAVAGADRVTFLHNMCTNDIKRLSAGEGCEAFCTDVKGKIVAQIFVTVCDDRLELVTVPDQAEALIAHLDRYIIREDVTLTDTTNDRAWLFATEGPALSDWVSTGAVSHVILPVEGGLRCMLGVGAEDLPLTVRTLQESGSAPCDASAWETLRIESELPLFGVDFDNSNLPQEINRDHLAIDFNKGCYLGQETIARIDALGHVNQLIVLVKYQAEDGSARLHRIATRREASRPGNEHLLVAAV